MIVYTDGSCHPIPGPGGWAWAVMGGPENSGSARNTTNQRMELQAVIEAVRALDGPLLVRSDSAYVVNCFHQRWWVGWQTRGWINAKGKPIVNRDLWEPLLDLVLPKWPDDAMVSFEHVKGHSGVEGNEYVDRLALDARKRLHNLQETATETIGYDPFLHGRWKDLW